MSYIIDASSLIQAQEEAFPFDVCPGFWAWLERHHAQKGIYSIDRVFKELDVGTGGLTQWARQRRTAFFLPIDEPTLVEMHTGGFCPSHRKGIVQEKMQSARFTFRATEDTRRLR